MYRQLIEAVQDFVMVINKDYKILYANQVAQKLAGNAEEADIRALKMGSDLSVLQALMIRHVETAAQPSIEECEIGVAGQKMICEIRSTPLNLGDGNTIGTAIFVKDITSQKMAEEARLASEKKFHIFCEGLSHAVVVIQEIDGLYRYVYVNPAFIDNTGYTLEDLKDKSFLDIIHHDFHSIVIERARMGLNGGAAPSQFEFKIIKKDGQEMWSSYSVSLIEYNGRPAILGSAHDITDIKKAQEAIARAEKMEAIGTLAGGIAHDFNNLLQSVMGYASLIEVDNCPDSENCHRAKLITDAAVSAGELTSQLLGFAREGRYNVVTLKINEEIAKAAGMFANTLPHIEIHFALHPEAWGIEADRTQIEQVLLNLYVNARQAMPSGGDLFLSTANVTVDDEMARRHDVKSGEFVKISITDTGMGMDHKTLARIFEPFFTTRGMGRGTGLGLAASYGIIRGHGGFINAYSEKGHGSTFNLYLPASQKDINQDRKTNGVARSGNDSSLG